MGQSPILGRCGEILKEEIGNKERRNEKGRGERREEGREKRKKKGRGK